MPYKKAGKATCHIKFCGQHQTQLKVSSACQTYDPQLATSTIDNESGAVCLTSTDDTERAVTYTDVSLNKQSKDSDTLSSSSDSDSRESESEEETYIVHCDG